MKLKLDIDPDIVAMMAAEVAGGERTVSAAMREAGTGLKSDWRGQFTGAGLGRRLANSIRNQNFPLSGASLDAAALVWSKAPVIVGARDTGPLIRLKDGFWPAITPVAAARSQDDTFSTIRCGALSDVFRWLRPSTSRVPRMRRRQFEKLSNRTVSTG